ncbi:transposase [Pelagibaculum spongiae]|uniref:Transposase n=1 Tax=Pelagibaculum spongiae TaxID=2080658 RepID=A0A2V1GQP3_9GAMM|nr:transposase [Pelagibaculum spongiae]PVZ66378.1 transposase [Pelagibaculum spongiae]
MKSSDQSSSDSAKADFSRRYGEKIEINKVGPRRVAMNPEYCHWFHCISRCCRKAFLCGEDPLTGESFEHRRQWIVDRLALLAQAFSVEIASYCVMSNHYHLVVCVNLEKAKSWQGDEVLRRWCKVFKGPELVRRYLDHEVLTPHEIDFLETFVEEYRERLVDLSWFMRALNEPLARQANKEDQCTGHFWQGRFTAQALLDEKAIASCMAYVDLNPLRAGIADTPEASEFTSIKQRIDKQRKSRSKNYQAKYHTAKKAESRATLPRLKPFKSKDPKIENIPFSFTAYLELLDATARTLVSGKASMGDDIPDIMTRLNIDPERWMRGMKSSRKRWGKAAGETQALQKYAKLIRQFWVQRGAPGY